MPNERMRALRWGFELLREIQADMRVDEADRRHAVDLIASYPGPEQLLRWVLDDAPCIPVPSATAIALAAELFRRVWRKPMSAETQHAVMFTLRHFPDAEEAMQMSVSVFGQSLHRWLRPDDCYR